MDLCIYYFFLKLWTNLRIICDLHATFCQMVRLMGKTIVAPQLCRVCVSLFLDWISSDGNNQVDGLYCITFCCSWSMEICEELLSLPSSPFNGAREKDSNWHQRQDIYYGYTVPSQPVSSSSTTNRPYGITQCDLVWSRARVSSRWWGRRRRRRRKTWTDSLLLYWIAKE